jgi:hypothetical protein
MADMLVGLITKIIKNLHQGFAYQSNEETLKMKLLSNEWFDINQKQLFLYHKMHIIINVLDHAWYKTYAGVYSDDLTVFIVFLNYMNNFETITDFNQIKNSDHAEYFNALCCEKLAEYYVRLRSKLSIEPITNNKTYFYNQKQAKIFFDISKQPVLKITNRNQIFDVLSVGISKEIIPLITILEGNTPLCFRLPLELLDWVTDCVNYANSGENLFPTKVMFNKKDDRYFANIL